MKKFLFSLALLGLGTSLSAALCQYPDGYVYDYPSGCPAGTEPVQTDSTTTTAEPTTVNTIINNTNRVEFSQSGDIASASAQLINSGDVTMLNIPLAYNVTNNIGLEAGVPLAKNKSNSGIGDVTLGVNYHFGHYGSAYGANVTTFTYKTTTGDENKGLGLGKPSMTLAHTFAKDLTTTYRFAALLSYTLNDDAALGNAMSAMIGGSRPCLLSNKVRTNAKVTYYKIDALNKPVISIPGLTSVDFWLEFSSDKLVNGVPLGAGVKVPLINQFEFQSKTYDAEKYVLFYLSASSFFK